MRYLIRLLLIVALATPAVLEAQQAQVDTTRTRHHRGERMERGMRHQMRGHMRGEVRSPARGQMRMRGEMGPGQHRSGLDSQITRLLENRTELDLSTEQVAELETLHTEITKRDEAFRARISERRARVDDSGDRARRRGEISQELEPLMRERREQNLEARRRLSEIVTTEQLQRSRELSRAHHQEGRSGG